MTLEACAEGQVGCPYATFDHIRACGEGGSARPKMTRLNVLSEVARHG
jgi:hypothetical protein